jgi:hypothetical protein
VMELDPIAPDENVFSLREGLAAHFKSDRYLRCTSMGALVRENIEMLRRHHGMGLGSLGADLVLKAPPLT